MPTGHLAIFSRRSVRTADYMLAFTVRVQHAGIVRPDAVDRRRYAERRRSVCTLWRTPAAVQQTRIVSFHSTLRCCIRWSRTWRSSSGNRRYLTADRRLARSRWRRVGAKGYMADIDDFDRISPYIYSASRRGVLKSRSIITRVRLLVPSVVHPAIPCLHIDRGAVVQFSAADKISTH